MNKRAIILNVLIAALFSVTNAQRDSLAEDSLKNWHLTNFEGEYRGINLEKAYTEILNNQIPQETIIVAVIDSGVDIEHEDLASVIWINKDEIAGNGLDDDNNGYIDDVNGWNFLGNANGDMVDNDNLEVTRLYVYYKEKFGDKKPAEEDLDEWKKYQRVKNEFEEDRIKASKEKEQYVQLKGLWDNSLALLEANFEKDDFTIEEVKAINSKDRNLNQAVGFYLWTKEQDITIEGLEEWGDYVKKKADWYWNPEVNVRRDIIKDDPNNLYEKGYGNNNVEGADPFHGTLVSAVIAGVRNNDLGGNGVANNVKIMPIRTVPGGDEHDKDVANAIRYAVDNGARVVNMSFGKAYSPHEKIVAEAIQYAEDNNVLLVGAAGNDGTDVDEHIHYPSINSPYLEGEIDNFMSVGASSHESGEALPADFSNYGDETVDVFAPGVAIYGAHPENTYGSSDGTSFAAPIVSGIAGLILSYYPDLTAKQVKDIIEESAIDLGETMVYLPGSGGVDKHGKELEKEVVAFSALSKTAGLVDVEAAIKLAQQTSKLQPKLKVEN